MKTVNNTFILTQRMKIITNRLGGCTDCGEEFKIGDVVLSHRKRKGCEYYHAECMVSS
ncbi:hypothetical protein KAS14_05710 [Candidatus Bathyarchaeota archaeon]|nr:hypothetical protein [Candidatus Bathyarchaeota archaeon]